MRASAVRLAERYLGSANPSIVKAVLALADDKNWNVRRQVAASIGELPAAARKDPALPLLKKFGSDPIMVDAVVSSIPGAEEQVLGDVLARGWPTECDGGGRRARGRSHAERRRCRHSEIVRAGHRRRASRRRFGWRCCRASTRFFPRPERRPVAAAGRQDSRSAGLSTPGAGEAFTPGRPVTLTAEPVELARLGSGPEPLATVAKSVVNKLDWPNRPAPAVIVPPLTPEQQKQFAAGAEIYKGLCVGCHQEDGKGKDKIGANLVDSAFVKSADPNAIIRVLLSGKEGTIGLMPPVGATYSDEQIAAVLTFVRRSWGNTAPPVDSLSVLEVRGLTKARNKPWTDDELKQVGGRGGRGGNAGRGGRGG